jgi:pilus assembly protein CpaC
VEIMKAIKIVKLKIRSGLLAPLLLLVLGAGPSVWSDDFKAEAKGAGNLLNLYIGETETINFGIIKRVAVGQGSIISTSILDGGQLLILAEAEGETEMTVWLEAGLTFEYKIIVNKNDINRLREEVSDLLRALPAISNRIVGNRIIIEGSVDLQGKTIVQQVAALYSDSVVDMTEQAQVGSQKMIYMNVQITEFNTNKLKALGINWQNSFNGPTAGYANEPLAVNRAGEVSVFSNSINEAGLVSPLGLSTLLDQDFGFFGIATKIASTINLARNNGDAIILAEPSLSARSGGEANFLSGGEVPLPVVGPDGQSSIEFKEFGIKLRIKPQADDLGNIIAEVETELSTVDPSLAVNGIPGFRTRKVSTDASLKHGQTLVISGLINKEVSANTTGLAFFSDIPILGALFRSQDFRNQKSELVIFVTPYIFDEASEINKKAIQRGIDLRGEFLSNVHKTSDILD